MLTVPVVTINSVPNKRLRRCLLRNRETARTKVRCSVVLPCLLFTALLLPSQIAVGQDAAAEDSFAAFVRAAGAELRSGDRVPESLPDWERRKQQLRQQLETAWGGLPSEPAPLEARILDRLSRDGYDVEKIVFQTFPGVFMTANAYVPHGDGRRPAVLCVHGHWRGAKQDPHVQARCIGLAKLGLFVLAVDAFGAGERGLEKALGEYHGEMTAATLLPPGRPLSGLQVYENQRAVDYLLTRPEVDGDRLGITGASGGGNQTMYAGAWDERFRAVVPVCSVGNYQAYLHAACCMCEVVPGALTFTEEWSVLALTAPRALMVVSATRDAFQFSVGEAQKSLVQVRPVFELYGCPQNVRHAVFESPHDYNREMREAMYGWMTLHLKGQGDGSPVPEPPHQTEDPEVLRCYPGDSRPDDWLTLPQFAAREARELLQHTRAADKPTETTEQRRQQLTVQRRKLQHSVLKDAVVPQNLTTTSQAVKPSATVGDPALQQWNVVFTPDAGLQLTASVRRSRSASAAGVPAEEVLLVVSTDDDASETVTRVINRFIAAGNCVVNVPLRA
ncbi:MAG: acetylxylan esterase, partial [Planctomycetaceae bacterium]|nr:acetylxylan esterase [Planctomycetaceae bacterium]